MTALAIWRLSWPYLGRQREVVEEEEVVVDVPARVALVPRSSPCPPPPRCLISTRPGTFALACTCDRSLCLQPRMVVRVHWHSVPLLVPNISLLVPIAVNYIPSFVSLQLPKMIQIISMDVENCLLTFTLE
jgi:hypothetical protein